MPKKEKANRGKFFFPVLMLVLMVWSSGSAETFPSLSEGKGGHPKLESALSEIQMRYLLHGQGLSGEVAGQRDLRIDALNKVTVHIYPRAGKTWEAIDIDSLEALGCEVLKKGRAVVKAKVPVPLLDYIADHVSGISFIKRPDLPHRKVVSEGVNLTGASLYQAMGISGQNVKVAVIDLGFDRLSSAIAAGALPSDVIRVDCTGRGGCLPTDFANETEEHGTAVAEVVHDMAPGAQLYLVKVDDNLDLKEAKDYCIENGIRIINHSVGWYNSNFYDGACYYDNPVCTADHAHKNGILWVNSAGNDAKSHYGATFIDRDGDRLHNVEQSRNHIRLYASAGDPIIALLTWEAWPETDQDFDLLLYDGSMNLAASSTNYQTGTQPPQEMIYFIPPASGTYSLAVRNAGATITPRFSLYTFYQDLDPHVASGSLVAPADAVGVMAVAAIDYPNWLNGPQESFSSQGPTADGRLKPEISGPDGVSSFIYGDFFGTSASSPHVVGGAALLLSNSPDLSLSQLWDNLVSSAIDLGAAGPDMVFGFGRLSLSTLSIDPVSVAFGDVYPGKHSDQAVTLRNIGSQNLLVGSISALSPPFEVISDSCSGRSILLGETCQIQVRFSPSLTGSFQGTLIIPSNDPFKSAMPIPLTGNGVQAIGLSAPADQLALNNCSFQSVPVFQWEVKEAFTHYQLQISWDRNFLSVPFEYKAFNTGYSLTTFQWRKVLLSLGASGGTLYWRVLGMKSDGATIASESRAISVPSPLPVGQPAITSTSREHLPTLSWQNQCNVKFRVWFGNDPGFLAKTGVYIQVHNPSLNGGGFTRTLTYGQWLGIRRLVGNQAGSKIYWYVQSLDDLNRLTSTEVMSFILEE